MYEQLKDLFEKVEFVLKNESNINEVDKVTEYQKEIPHILNDMKTELTTMFE